MRVLTKSVDQHTKLKRQNECVHGSEVTRRQQVLLIDHVMLMLCKTTSD